MTDFERHVAGIRDWFNSGNRHVQGAERRQTAFETESARLRRRVAAGVPEGLA
jgi:hypothetical protein